MKGFAPKKLKCIKDSLRAITKGKEIQDKQTGTQPKNRFLQQDNYVIDRDRQLNKLEDII
jgi:hypothetical protein